MGEHSILCHLRLHSLPRQLREKADELKRRVFTIAPDDPQLERARRQVTAAREERLAHDRKGTNISIITKQNNDQ